MLDTWICDGYNAGRIEYIYDAPKAPGQSSMEVELLRKIVIALRHISNSPEAMVGALRNFANFIVRTPVFFPFL